MPFLHDAVNQRFRITLNIGTAEILTSLRKVPRFLPGGLRHLTKQKDHYVASVTDRKY